MFRAPSTALLLLVLSACGGGGGTSLNPPEAAFSSFSAVQPNTTVVMGGGISRTVTGTSVGGLPNVTAQTVDAPVENAGAGNTIRLIYDGTRTLSGMVFNTPTGNASFSRTAGTTFTCTTGVCGAQTASGQALVIDGTAPVPGWNYQTFGVWGQLTSATTFQAGAISAGVVTPASAVPTTGTPTFTGLANGFFVESVGGVPGIPAFMRASMTANVNFGTGSIAFSTSGSMQVPLNTAATPFSRPALDMTGTLSYTPGASSTFTGSVATGGNAMTGTATGRFYGPVAQEMGGTFSLSGTTGTLVGGFGGRRP